MYKHCRQATNDCGAKPKKHRLQLMRGVLLNTTSARGGYWGMRPGIKLNNRMKSETAIVKSITIACIGMLLPCLMVSAQVKSMRFTRDVYQAGAQNWAFQQDESGTIYVANNEGLLTFNGAFWRVHPLPNSTILRSIAFGRGKQLFAGGQDEIGYYEPDATGRLGYRSLIGQIPVQYRQFADIWHIVTTGSEVFFQSFSTIFRFHNQTITPYPSLTKWDFLGKADNRVLAHDKSAGLLEFTQGRWDTLAAANELPAGMSITAVVPCGSALLLTTAYHGLWQLRGKSLAPFSGKKMPPNAYYTSAETLPNGQVVLGTYDDGIILTDTAGNLLDSYNSSDGLVNNNVKSIFRDSQNQIWLGLEDGISVFDLNNPVQWFHPEIFNGAAGYAVAVADNRIFFATANGLYDMETANLINTGGRSASIRKIAGGLTWNVVNEGGRIFAGRDDGLFACTNGQLQPIDQNTGYWTVRALPKAIGLPAWAAGSYQGISFFENRSSSLVKASEVPNFVTSARYVEFDSTQAALWVSHPYRGIYKIDAKSRRPQYYGEKDGLPSTLNNHLFSIKNRILVATLQGVYEYDRTGNRFKPAEGYNKAFNGISLRYLKADAQNNLWFVSEKKLGVLDAATGSIYYFPELQRKLLSGFEHIFPLDARHLFIGGEQGFFILNYASYINKKVSPSVFIRSVTGKVKTDTTLYGGFGTPGLTGKPVNLSHNWTELTFDFSAPYTTQSPHLEYSYRLKGLDNNWSSWTNRTQKSYSQLQPGDYVFEVKVRNNLLAESAVVSYAFSVSPPWYSSTWAKLLYALLLAAGVYAVLKLQARQMRARHAKKMAFEKQKFEEQQKLQTYQHQLAIEKSERELVQLRNEKLESELAATAMNLVQKKEFLLKIREEINKLKQAGTRQVEATDLKKVLKDLTTEDKLDEEWEQFSRHFNHVHNNFLVTLKEKYPQLTAHDLKLCAYLRMNLSSKEIARLMSISIRGVEINRYRLRKKLPLETKESLFDFLLKLEKE
ncbi:MAG: hypothetical protein MUF24_06205 [Chitinophagaceae bacterium]|nr:hypothetical protein [Chitinophagaceae bacterium]